MHRWFLSLTTIKKLVLRHTSLFFSLPYKDRGSLFHQAIASLVCVTLKKLSSWRSRSDGHLFFRILYKYVYVCRCMPGTCNVTLAKG
jgi:hypothetical protein